MPRTVHCLHPCRLDVTNNIPTPEFPHGEGVAGRGKVIQHEQQGLGKRQAAHLAGTSLLGGHKEI